MSEFERSEADQLLAGLWAQDEPPARDPAFVIAAMERIERRRLLEGVLALVPVALAASLLLWALAPLGPYPFRSIPASFSNTAQTAAVSWPPRPCATPA